MADGSARDELEQAAVAASGCRRVEGFGVAFCETHDELGNPPWDRCRWVEALAVLTPVVERLQRQAAAKAVRQIADELAPSYYDSEWVIRYVDELRARADDLDPS
jgi:hypothetical protein